MRMTVKPSIDPEKRRESALVSLRTKAFLANGGKIQHIPIGASSLVPDWNSRKMREHTWRESQSKKAEATRK